MSAKLVGKSWLCRILHIQEQGEGFISDHYIKYDGQEIGHETVYVNSIPVSSSISLFWFTPRFAFSVDGQKAILKVRISPWLTVQSLQLFIGDSLEYVEGKNQLEQIDFTLECHYLHF